MRKPVIFTVFCLLCLALQAQNKRELVANFSFNSSNAVDEVKGREAKVVGATLVRDRFGNARSAYYLHGNYGSYLNLGTDSTLRPDKGTVSLWLNIDNPIFAGRGLEINPVILAKSQPGDDFYEGYFIGYDFNLKKIVAATTLAEHMQVTLHTADTVPLREWIHLAITYDDNFLCLYLNGELETKMAKNFHSKFLASDSVMVGNSANTKNKRFLNGTVDDIQIYNRVLSPEEIKDLFNAPDPKAYKVVVKWILRVFYFLAGLGIIIWLVSLYFKRKLEQEKKRNELQNRMAEMEMRIIKAQMNPHFIFNSLNSIQQFILANENDKAQVYLAKFSRLIRKLLESNTKENVLLSEEIELLKKYLEIESLRFNNAFTYTISVDENLHQDAVQVPHFLIQPFVENAIWHGLLPKKGDKKLEIQFRQLDKKALICIIDDNGVGRRPLPQDEPAIEKKSLAINFIRQRLEFLSRLHDYTYNVEINDKTQNGQSAGTTVKITLPVIN